MIYVTRILPAFSLLVLLNAGALVSANFCNGEFLPDADYVGDSGITCSEFAAMAYDQIGGKPQAWSHKTCALEFDTTPIFYLFDYVAPQCCSTGVTKCDMLSSPDLCLNPKNYAADKKLGNTTCGFYKRLLEYSADIKADDGRAGPWTASTCRQNSRIFGAKAGKIMTYMGAYYGCCGVNKGEPLDVCSSKMGMKRKEKSAAFYAALASTSSASSEKSVHFTQSQNSKLGSRGTDTPALKEEEETFVGNFLNDIMEPHVNIQDVLSKTTLKLRAAKAVPKLQ